MLVSCIRSTTRPSLAKQRQRCLNNADSRSQRHTSGASQGCPHWKFSSAILASRTWHTARDAAKAPGLWKMSEWRNVASSSGIAKAADCQRKNVRCVVGALEDYGWDAESAGMGDIKPA